MTRPAVSVELTDERLCVTCAVLAPARDKPRHYERANVCEGCRGRLASLLAELPGLVELLPAGFVRQARPQLSGSRVRSTPQPSEPLRWFPYDLCLPADPRKVGLRARVALGAEDYEAAEDLKCQDGALSVATELDAMVADWLTYRTGYPPAPTVRSLCGWLSDRLEWACEHHPAIDECAAILVELTRATRSAGHARSGGGEFVGRCPRVTRDGGYCATPLRVDSFASRIVCSRCGSEWDRDREGDGGWLRLSAAQRDAGLSRDGAA